MKNLRLKAARAALDMSQQDLADKVGVSRQTINAIEKGVSPAGRHPFKRYDLVF